MPRPDRICITGCGVVSPLGNGLDEFWRRLNGKPIPATQVRGFDASRYRVDLAHEVEGAGKADDGARASAFALRATRSALGEKPFALAPDRVGISLGTTACGWQAGQRLSSAFRRDKNVAVDEFLGGRGERTRDAFVRAIADELEVSGPVAVHSAACAASAYAMSWGAERIRAGEADIVIAGGVDVLTELAYAGFHSVRALAPDACRPFSKGRRGIVLGEGAAVIVLESEDSAHRRGATVIAELLGYACATDTRDMTNPSAAALEGAMAAALEDAGCHTGSLDSISAHGTGTRANDQAEAEAIAGLLGGEVDRVPVCAVKSALGHTQGAAAAFGCLGAAMTVASGRRPPLRNYLAADPELPPLRFAEDRSAAGPTGGAVLVNAFGFGGATTSLVIGPGESAKRPTSRPRRRLQRPVFLSKARGLLPGSPGLSTGDRAGWAIEPAPTAGDSSPLSLVAAAMKSICGEGDLGGACGAYLGTFFGSQAIHEEAAAALERVGPAGYRPRDFAVSTYNAPVGAAALELGLQGPTTTLLGINAGIGAIGAAAELVASRRCERMVAGGYDEPTTMLAAAMRQQLQLEVGGGAALLMLDSGADTGLIEVAGWASSATASAWPDPDELERVLGRLGAAELDMVIFDSEGTGSSFDRVVRQSPFLKSAEVLCVASQLGNHPLAAAGPLGVILALDALAVAGSTAAVVAAGPMTGVDAVLLRRR